MFILQRETTKQSNSDKQYVVFIKKTRTTVDVKPKKILFDGRLFVSHYYHNNRKRNVLKIARYIGSATRAWFNYFVYLNKIYKYKFDREIKNYILQKEDIYIPEYTAGVHYSFKGIALKAYFPGITKRKLAKILTPTENIFKTKIETSKLKLKIF